MLATKKSPTQATKRIPLTRCDHGYYVHAPTLETPRCPWCHGNGFTMHFTPFQGQIDPKSGRFRRMYAVPPGHARCWRCESVKPLEAFRRAKSKPNGRQSRCKKCENRIQMARRRAFH